MQIGALRAQLRLECVRILDIYISAADPGVARRSGNQQHGDVVAIHAEHIPVVSDGRGYVVERQLRRAFFIIGAGAGVQGTSYD